VDGLPQGLGQPPVALLAGLLCGFGNGFQFMGGQAAGYAAADPVHALPLVSTFWGVLLFVVKPLLFLSRMILLLGLDKSFWTWLTVRPLLR